MNKPKEHQKLFNAVISIVLQIGVSVSAFFIIFGLVMFFNGHNLGQYSHYVSPNFSFPHSYSALYKAIAKSSSLGFIVLGLLTLILTPILRVATSILLFLAKKDRPMSIVTFSVLIILIGSFLLGVLVR